MQVNLFCFFCMWRCVYLQRTMCRDLLSTQAMAAGALWGGPEECGRSRLELLRATTSGSFKTQAVYWAILSHWALQDQATRWVVHCLQKHCFQIHFWTVMDSQESCKWKGNFECLQYFHIFYIFFNTTTNHWHLWSLMTRCSSGVRSRQHLTRREVDQIRSAGPPDKGMNIQWIYVYVNRQDRMDSNNVKGEMCSSVAPLAVHPKTTRSEEMCLDKVWNILELEVLSAAARDAIAVAMKELGIPSLWCFLLTSIPFKDFKGCSYSRDLKGCE